MRTEKTEREEAAYIAGRIDAQVLCNTTLKFSIEQKTDQTETLQ